MITIISVTRTRSSVFTWIRNSEVQNMHAQVASTVPYTMRKPNKSVRTMCVFTWTCMLLSSYLKMIAQEPILYLQMGKTYTHLIRIKGGGRWKKNTDVKNMKSRRLTCIDRRGPSSVCMHACSHNQKAVLILMTTLPGRSLVPPHSDGH